jgi:hypothetical protein
MLLCKVAAALTSSSGINFGAFAVSSAMSGVQRLNAANVCTSTLLAPLMAGGTPGQLVPNSNGVTYSIAASPTGNCSVTAPGTAVSCVVNAVKGNRHSKCDGIGAVYRLTSELPRRSRCLPGTRLLSGADREPSRFLGLLLRCSLPRAGRAVRSCLEPREALTRVARLDQSFPSSLIIASRMANFCALPVTVLGSSATSRT